MDGRKPRVGGRSREKGKSPAQKGQRLNEGVACKEGESDALPA